MVVLTHGCVSFDVPKNNTLPMHLSSRHMLRINDMCVYRVGGSCHLVDFLGRGAKLTSLLSRERYLKGGGNSR